MPIRIRGRGPSRGRRVGLEEALKAINLVREGLEYFVAGPPLIHRGPGGEVHIDIPLMYNGYALDRIHYDPVRKEFAPKGGPVHVSGVTIDRSEVVENVKKMVRELRVIDAVEYREPEDAWVVPLAWKHYIVAHVKVSSDGEELIPDYPLTEELSRDVL